MKSLVVEVSGTTASLNLPIFASKAFRPSKKTTSPRSSTNRLTSSGLRCFPPPTTPLSSTFTSVGRPKVTSSALTFTLSLGKSESVPSDHLKSIPLKPSNSRVLRTYRLSADMAPPRVPLIPWSEIRIRPLRPSASQRSRCQSRIASGSAIGVKA